MSKPDAPSLRRARLLRRIRREKLDALLVTNVHNVRYLSGFLGDDSALLVTPERTILLTDSRYAEQAESETRGIGIVVRKKGMMPVAAATARKAGVRTLGVEGRAMTMAEAEDLRKALPQRRGPADARDGRAAPDDQGRVGDRRDLARGRDRRRGVPPDAAAGRAGQDRARAGADPRTDDAGPGRG